MKYALLIYSKPGSHEALPADEAAAVSREYFALREEPEVFDGGQLQPIETATTLRMNGAEMLTTDGPFAETREQLGGYYMVDAKDLDEAIAIAARLPSARHGSIEVRPVWPMN